MKICVIITGILLILNGQIINVLHNNSRDMLVRTHRCNKQIIDDVENKPPIYKVFRLRMLFIFNKMDKTFFKFAYVYLELFYSTLAKMFMGRMRKLLPVLA